jgi:adenine-specific DNA-methyltransferase
MKADESLLICCTSYSKAADKYPNITVKKIPKMLLGRCEFGKEDYSLNIVRMPRDVDEPDFVPTGSVASTTFKEKKKAYATGDLFASATSEVHGAKSRKRR